MDERDQKGDNGRFISPDAATPLVSVVIPCYNYGRYLGYAIDSVLGQDYPNVECIVVDDGSTDNSHEVAETYGSKIRYIHKDNAGLSAARNTGIESARGTYIVFLDADDMLKPRMVSTCLAKFADLGEDCAAVAGKGERVDSSGKTLGAANRHPSCGGLTSADLILRNRFPADGIVVRRSVFERCGGFDTELTSSEDRDMWIRIAAKYQLWLLDEPIVQVRSHEGSMSCNSGRMYTNMRRVLQKARAADGAPASVAFWSAAFAFCDYQVAWMYSAERRWLPTFALLARSALRHPVFLDPGVLESKPLFRLRAFRLFLLNMLGGSR